MGEQDSSRTRVVPVFDRLYQSDPTGESWLPGLLRLPEGGNGLSLSPGCRLAIREHGWGRNEKPLEPPVALLSWLIRNPREPQSGELSADPTKQAKRRDWLGGSSERIREGLNLLRNNPANTDWHIFEGPSYPDAYIETDDLVVVVEGKRTERHPTTSTKWMKGRHQMLRHIDCAWEQRGRKQVVGLFVVEGNARSSEVSPEWLEFSASTISPDAVSSSLPHRGPEEQRAIASCFIGATTWRRICQEFEIDCRDFLNGFQ